MALSDSISSCTVSSIDYLPSHFCIYVTISDLNKLFHTPAMINSGATGYFIYKQFMKEYKIIWQPLKRAIDLCNIDRTSNNTSAITHYTQLKLTVRSQLPEVHNFFVTDIGPENIILGLLWLKNINPHINWDTEEVTLPDSFKATPDPESLSFTKVEANWS